MGKELKNTLTWKETRHENKSMTSSEKVSGKSIGRRVPPVSSSLNVRKGASAVETQTVEVTYTYYHTERKNIRI
jgi:hypothetical protein